MFKKGQFICFILFFSTYFAGAVDDPVNLIRVCHDNDQNTLIWENPEDICGTFEKNVIYHRTSDGDEFEIIDTVDEHEVEEYEHSSGFQFNSEYFIKIYYDCFGQDGYYSDTLEADHEPPQPVQIDSISYHNGEWIMGWSPTDPDIMGYEIYRVDGGDNIIENTNYGRDSTSYVISETEDLGVEEYRIAAFDSCRNISAISEPHQNTFLESSIDECLGEVELTWDLYQGWDEGVEKHQILMSRDGALASDFEVIAEGEFEDGSIILDDLEEGETFWFFVRSFKANSDEVVTSSSNRVEIFTEFIKHPSDLYLKSVDYIDDNSLNIKWEVSTDGDISHFEILRSTDTVFLETHDQMNYDENEGLYSYVDDEVSPDEEHYFYKIKVVDICDGVIDTSNFGRNIVIDGDSHEDFIEIYWNSYFTWDEGVENYYMERTLTLDDPHIWENYASFSSAEINFLDSAQFEEMGNEGVCYRITAREVGSDPFGDRNTAESNTICFVEEAIVHIPNAFRPEGNYNTVFRPEGQFIDMERSSMQIYNRFGQRIFNTDNLEESGGWDGTEEDSEKVHKEGTYMYKIEIRGIDDNINVFSGTINLIR